jgi:hypothetical protein
LGAILLIFAWFALRMIGCVPYSKHPLTDRKANEKDPRLIGDWFHVQGGETLHLHVGHGKQPGSLRLVMVEQDSDSVLDLTRWTGHISRLDGNRYLNVEEVPPDPNTPGYLFVKYRIEGDRLCLALASDQKFQEAIQAGRLQGNVRKEKYGSTVFITEKQKGLQPFVRENVQELFPDESCLTRLQLPETTALKAPEPEK